ncbi:hypothetical protein ES708_10418 [subsurface metagenome]
MATVSNYIRQIQSYEEFAFSWEELLEKTNAPEPTLRKELVRLSAANEIINIRKGFYLIIPPRYVLYGKIPLELYVDKLFKYLDKSYYIGFYSAAVFWGAAHQRIQQDYVITAPPALREIKKKNIIIRFFNAHNWPQKNILQKNSDAGYFNLSSPALTFADLIHNHPRLGGLNRMLVILEELLESLQLNDLGELLTWYKNKSVLQRMGYLMDEFFRIKKFSNKIFNHLRTDTFFPVLLSPRIGEKAGSAGNRWKVDVNIKLDGDL